MSEERKTQWHSAFYPAMMMELREDKEYLKYEKEYILNTSPLKMDMLIVKKKKDIELKNEIGRIFKGHNIVEYKSPGDSMGIDQYFKIYAYASLYKAASSTSDGIPAEDITVTLVRKSRPEKLFKWFQKRGCTIEEKYKGIYYIGDAGFFETQVIVSRELEGINHIWIKALTDRIKEQEFKLLVTEMEKLKSKDEKEYAYSILHVTAKVNRELLEKMKEEKEMLDVLKEIMKPEIEESEQKGKREGELKRAIECADNIMEEYNATLEEACKVAGIMVSQYHEYKETLCIK